MAIDPTAVSPRVDDGPGIKVGDRSTFHPGFALLVGYDSNVFNVSTKREKDSQVHAAFTMPTAWIGIGNRKVRDGVLDSPAKPSARKVDYYFGLFAGYRFYLSGNPLVRQAGKFNGGGRLHLRIAPGRRFSVELGEEIVRMAEPRNFEAGRAFNFNRINHSGSLRFVLRPGGGRLSLSTGYRNKLLYFEAADIPVGDRTVNGVEHETRYRFKDRSALAVRYSFLYTYYFSCCASPGTGRNEDSAAHRVLAGYTGMFGKRWTLDAFGGYGAGLYKDDTNGPDHKNVIGHVGLGFYPTMRTRLELRGERRFEDSIFGNYFSDVGGSFYAHHGFRSRTKFTTGVGVYSRRYAGIPIPGQDTQDIASYENAEGFVRKDILVNVHFQLEQSIGKFFVLAARYTFAMDETDFAIRFATDQVDYGGFQRHMAMLFGAVRY